MLPMRLLCSVLLSYSVDRVVFSLTALFLRSMSLASDYFH